MPATARQQVELSPAGLAEVLGQRPPTSEQAEVIAAGLEPMVVVAGAGSGKSETMAARVVWLVANGFVRPERVLGLTFTRKAAAELGNRVRARLEQLRAAGVVDASVSDGDPMVATYHSYAARIVGDHALREALEPSLRLITPAVQWQLAHRVVAAYDGPMDAVDWAPPTVTAAVLEIAQELAEHLRTTDDVRDLGEWLRARAERLSGRLPAAVTKLLRSQQTREQLLPLVEGYRAEKAAREVMDHGDQVALAARVAHRHDEVGAIERARYSVVLLDEYQDTSHCQLVLLRSLFGGGHPVTAVGDPCQSIYGWRGASAGNLRRFARDFRTRRGEPAGRAQLGTSFRSGERILDAAGVLSGELREQAPEVPLLRPGPARRRRGLVSCALLETAHEEANWVADHIAALLGTPVGSGTTAPDGLAWPEGERAPDACVHPADVAVLARKRSQFPRLRRALEARGIPVEVVGLGGLLTVPEVHDVVATLRVLHDPTAGNALARLLTGPRWRLGPRDLVALGERARELATLEDRDVPAAGDGGERPARHAGEGEPGVGGGDDEPGGTGADAAAGPLRRAVDELMSADAVSLVDALDDLGPRERYSSPGHARLEKLAGELRELRRRLDQPLPDLAADVERALGLDIEVTAAPGANQATARADLDAFIGAAAAFASDEEEPTLGAFLAYLRAADDQEFGLESGRVSDTDSVKLMTVHAAKGLQWPVVAVPGLAAGKGRSRVFPAVPRTSTRWTDNPRKLPFPLRGDRDDLPELTSLDKAGAERFADDCATRHELEERRLAYVAATRASFALLCSGYWWGESKSRLGPSVFLTEIRDACLAGAGDVAVWAPEPDGDVRAEPEQEATVWPGEPAGARHDAVAAGAQLVEEALAGAEQDWLAAAGAAGPGDDPDWDGWDGWDDWDEGCRARARGWELDGRLLLAERERRGGRSALEVELPGHLSVSSLVDLARDPAALARSIRRPMPRPPAPYARRGTAFHGWLESRYGQQRLLDPDEIPGAADDDDGIVPATDLDELRRCFEASEWAALTPVDVEVPFETAIGDRFVRGRMDAVFRSVDAAGDVYYDVVDWKTGSPPSPQAAPAASVQLAAYRLAWAELTGVAVERVRAAFHYVRTNETVRPVDLLDADGLAALIESVPRDPG